MAEPERHTVYLDERRPVRDRDAALRVLAFRAGERFAVAFLAVALLAVAFLAGALLAGALLAGALLAVDLLAVDLLAVDLLAVARLAVDFFAVDLFAVARFAVAFFAVDFLAVARFAVAFFAVDFFAVERFAVAFFAVDFFFAAAFFTPAFFAVAFLAAAFRVDPERELELFAELRPDERDVDRAAAGTVRAISGASSISSIVVSPMVDSPPHVSSAPTVGSLHEPALGVCDASPVPLQSSSVM